eukprot:7336229-Prymnesium_polylepis.1
MTCCMFGIVWILDTELHKLRWMYFEECCNLEAKLVLGKLGDRDFVHGCRSRVVGGKILSQYELDRLDNIARNKAVLQALGLDDALTGKLPASRRISPKLVLHQNRRATATTMMTCLRGDM